MKIEISDATKKMLDDFRKELCGYASQANDLDFMKAIENASYSSLIQLLNFGFDEKLMVDSCNGVFKASLVEVELTPEGRERLLGALKSD